MDYTKSTFDHITSSRGSNYEELWAAIVSSIAAGLCSFFTNIQILPITTGSWISGILTAVSAVFIFLFYNCFANVTKNLEFKVSSTTRIFAFCTSATMLLHGAALVLRQPIIQFIGYIPAIIGLIMLIKLGVILKKHYTGLLGEIGHNIITSLIKFPVGIGIIMIISLICVLIFPITIAMVIITILCIAFPIWWFVIFYSSVLSKMIDFIEEAFFNK